MYIIYVILELCKSKKKDLYYVWKVQGKLCPPILSIFMYIFYGQDFFLKAD